MVSSLVDVAFWVWANFLKIKISYGFLIMFFVFAFKIVATTFQDQIKVVFFSLGENFLLYAPPIKGSYQNQDHDKTFLRYQTFIFEDRRHFSLISISLFDHDFYLFSIEITTSLLIKNNPSHTHSLTL